MEKLICTFNVNSIRARKDLTIEWLKRSRIDILCLRGSEKFYYKLEFYKRFLEFLKAEYSPADKICLLGDFNVAIEDIDVYDILRWGFVDAFRYMYPDKIQYTWWDYIGGKIWKDQGMRIDYILVTEPLLKHIKDIWVDLWPRRRRTPKPSDHAPLIGKFEL